MINFETFCRIHYLHDHDALGVARLAQALSLDARTVAIWLARPHYRPRRNASRASKLDPFKPTIRQLVERHPYSAVQILARLREADYEGGISILKDYLRTVRPRRAPAFLTLAFAPGECARVDRGQRGSVKVGNTRRKLSFFVMVLCYSRLMYLEFTVSQTLEHFLACHQHAFEFFGDRVPSKIMVDNLKSAVLERLTGQAPVFNPTGFQPSMAYSPAPYQPRPRGPRRAFAALRRSIGHSVSPHPPDSSCSGLRCRAAPGLVTHHALG